MIFKVLVQESTIIILVGMTSSSSMMMNWVYRISLYFIEYVGAFPFRLSLTFPGSFGSYNNRPSYHEDSVSLLERA